MKAIVCPKCQYLRKEAGIVPLWQCPACKTPYSQVESPQKSNVAVSHSAASRVEESPVKPVGRPEIIRTWAFLIIVIGILPWSYFCITSLGPTLSIQHMGLKGMVFSIIAVPVLLIWFVGWLTSLYE